MTVGVGFGWCGFGAQRWRLRLGWLELWACRGSVFERIGLLYAGLAKVKRDLMQGTQV